MSLPPFRSAARRPGTRSRRTLPGLAALAALAVLTGACNRDAATDTPPLDDTTRAVDDSVKRAMAQYQVPGVAAAVIEHGDVVWTHGYGMADEAKKVAVGPSTVFQVASMSKTVTAWGVVRLAEKGQIDVDAPIETYLHRWHLPPSRFDRSAVTARRLLSHTAGLSVHGYAGYPADKPLPSLEESLSGASGAGAVTLVQAPGSGLLYSGGGYTVLQLAVEEITGQPFAAYMRANVLTPLGMSSSAFEWLPDLRSRTATAYASTGEAVPTLVFTEEAAAGLYSTVADFARFVAAGTVASGTVTGRDVVAAPDVTLMQTPAAATDGGYGLGHEISEAGPVRVVGHNGANAGWQSLWTAVPEHGAGLVVLTNSQNGFALTVQVLCDWIPHAGAATAACP